MSPPSTACSASIECGGVRTSTMSPSEARRALAGPATIVPESPLLLGDDGHRKRDVDVGVQVQIHGMLPDHAQRTVRQAHLAAGDVMTGARGCLGDVGRADGAEELPLGACLRVDGEPEFLERLGALLGARVLFLCQFLELCG